jgi:hypothetical protein
MFGARIAVCTESEAIIPGTEGIAIITSLDHMLWDT